MNLFSKIFALITNLVLLVAGDANCQIFLSPKDTNTRELKSSFYYNYDGITGSEEDGRNAQFERFDKIWSSRLVENGSFLDAKKAFLSVQEKLNLGDIMPTSVNADWYALGPNINSNQETGRVNCIAFSPFDPSTFYLGSASGGIWRTINAGASWSVLNTDKQLARLGISDIAIDPILSSTGLPIIYAATGDCDGGITFSDGIYRSIDGGQTWAPINNNLFSQQTNSMEFVYNILVDNTIGSSIMFAATSLGLYKCLNRFASQPYWDKVYPAAGNELVSTVIFKPNSNNTELFASGINIIHSATSGNLNSWVSIANSSSGLDLTNTPLANEFPGKCVKRIQLAIADNNSLYALCQYTDNCIVRWNTCGYYSFYKYEFSTSLFSLRKYIYGSDDCAAVSVNVHTPNAGRVAFAVSPNNPDIVYAGNVNLSRTTNGGITPFTMVSTCAHVDYHCIKFNPNNSNELYTATDGGIYKNIISPINCYRINTDLNITQLWGGSSSETDPNQILLGLQDNGGRYLKNSIWTKPQGAGADGFNTLIDYSNTTNMIYTNYGAINGILNRNIGNTSYPIFSPPQQPIQESTFGAATNIRQDPLNQSILYFGRRPDIFKSSNFFTSTPPTYTKISNFLASPYNVSVNQLVKSIAIAPSNPNYIYTALTPYYDPPLSNDNYRLFMTSSGGGFNNWQEISPTISSTQAITGIAVSSVDPTHIWVTYSGYNALLKVKEYVNGIWSDVNQGLPNVPINCIVFEKGSNDGLYIGTDVGVYYKNKAMTQWEPFMFNLNGDNRLPNVVISELEINYKANKIRAYTFGRGAWESHLFCPNSLNFNVGSVTNTVDFVEAQNYIHSSQIINDFNVIYRAGEYIELQTGFEATPGMDNSFLAYIYSCTEGGNSARIGQVNPFYVMNEFSIPNNVEENVHQDIKIKPNPNNGKFSIEIVGGSDDSQIEIYNSMGGLVKRLNSISGNELNVELENINVGIYIIKFNTKDFKKSISKKLIIKK